MKKYIYIFCFLGVMIKMNADDVILKELKFSNHYTLKQQAFLHTMTTNNNLSGVRGMCEFTIGDTLYILSSVYSNSSLKI